MSLAALKGYNSSDESSNQSENEEKEEFNFEFKKELSTLVKFDPAPLVLHSTEKDDHKFIDDNTKILEYNPRYEDLYAPKFGPENPHLTAHQRAPKNTLNGYVESTNVSNFQFENQRRTFYAYGYAQDPSKSGEKLVGDLGAASNHQAVTVFENKSGLDQPKEKRKKIKNDDPSDIDGYLGPWATFENQITVARPSEEEKLELAEILAKRKRRQRVVQEEVDESKSTLHIEDPYDYLGRSFLHIPQDLDKNLRTDVPEKCFIPKKCVHTYSGHTKGVQRLALFPVSGHLFLSCSMDHKIKLWEFYKDRRLIRTFIGHTQGVRDVNFNRNGTEFLSASFDRNIKLWDTETGQMKGKFSTKKTPYCVVFNPNEDKQHLFVAGMADKKIICWDTRSGEIVQEYDRHLGAVNTITFVDNNRRIVTTSDDKSVRAWEWDIPVDFKYIADPTMHSMPATRLSPNERYLAFQSMDNTIRIMEPNANFRWKSKKIFRGHLSAGYACGIDFSPDMGYLISGDSNGRCVIWDWKTRRIFERINAHTQVCMDVRWHPRETSKILTCGWDGLIKLWD